MHLAAEKNFYAVDQPALDTITALLDAGADRSIENNAGHTPLAVAKQNGYDIPALHYAPRERTILDLFRSLTE